MLTESEGLIVKFVVYLRAFDDLRGNGMQLMWFYI